MGHREDCSNQPHPTSEIHHWTEVAISDLGSIRAGFISRVHVMISLDKTGVVGPEF